MIIQYSMQIVNRLRATPRPEEQIFLPNDEKWPPLPFRGPNDLQTKSPLTEGALRFHSEGAELLKITSARRVSLRCGTQFASYLRLIALRMTIKLVGGIAS